MTENDPNRTPAYGTPAGGDFQQIDPYGMDQPPPKRGLSTRKVLLIVFGGLAACLLICVVAGFLLFRSIQSGFESVIDDGITALVEEEIGATGAVQPGTYVITTDQFLAALNQELTDGGANIDELFVRILPGNRIELGVAQDGQDLDYTLRIAAEDGKLKVLESDASNSFLDWIAPGDRIASGLEKGFNNYLSANNMRLVSLSTEQDELTVVIE